MIMRTLNTKNNKQKKIKTISEQSTDQPTYLTNKKEGKIIIQHLDPKT